MCESVNYLSDLFLEMLMTYHMNIYLLHFEIVIYVTANLLLHLQVVLVPHWALAHSISLFFVLVPHWALAHSISLFFLQGARLWASELEKARVLI